MSKQERQEWIKAAKFCRFESVAAYKRWLKEIRKDLKRRGIC